MTTSRNDVIMIDETCKASCPAHIAVRGRIKLAAKAAENNN
ncbi:MAG: hypothetical protein RSE64_02765 [Oscillospiraceae bacterium]